MAQRELARAAAACRSTGLTEWELVDYATRLVGAHFVMYSVLRPWESPEVAFRRRRGFCTQYNGALALVLQRLGLQAWLVYATRVRFDDGPDWTLGHTWVRVRTAGEVRDVCSRSLANSSGSVHFVPIGEVRELNRATRFLTTVASFGAAVAAITRARALGRPRPQWVEHPRSAP